MSIERMAEPIRLLREVAEENGMAFGMNDMTALSAFWTHWKDKLTPEKFKRAAVAYKQDRLDMGKEPI